MLKEVFRREILTSEEKKIQFKKERQCEENADKVVYNSMEN